MSGAVNPNTPLSPPVCTMFNETLSNHVNEDEDCTIQKSWHIYWSCHWGGAGAGPAIAGGG